MTEADEVIASIPKIHPTFAEQAIAILDAFLHEIEILGDYPEEIEWNN